MFLCVRDFISFTINYCWWNVFDEAFIFLWRNNCVSTTPIIIKKSKINYMKPFLSSTLHPVIPKHALQMESSYKAGAQEEVTSPPKITLQYFLSSFSSGGSGLDIAISVP